MRAPRLRDLTHPFRQRDSKPNRKYAMEVRSLLERVGDVVWWGTKSFGVCWSLYIPNCVQTLLLMGSHVDRFWKQGGYFIPWRWTKHTQQQLSRWTGQKTFNASWQRYSTITAARVPSIYHNNASDVLESDEVIHRLTELNFPARAPDRTSEHWSLLLRGASEF
jgi:hypothetical protein